MPLIIEDGTGVQDANSYVTVDEFLEYMSEYHPHRAELDYTLAEASILRGTRFVDSLNFVGSKSYANTRLQWPRITSFPLANYLPSDVIPWELKQSVFEASIREYDNPGSLTPDTNKSNQVIERTVGPIKTKYVGGSNTTSLSVVSRLLSRFLLAGNGETVVSFPLRT